MVKEYKDLGERHFNQEQIGEPFSLDMRIATVHLKVKERLLRPRGKNKHLEPVYNFNDQLLSDAVCPAPGPMSRLDNDGDDSPQCDADERPSRSSTRRRNNLGTSSRTRRSADSILECSYLLCTPNERMRTAARKLELYSKVHKVLERRSGGRKRRKRMSRRRLERLIRQKNFLD